MCKQHTHMTKGNEISGRSDQCSALACGDVTYLITHGVRGFVFKRDQAAPFIVSKGHSVRLVGKRMMGLKLISR